MGRRSVEVLTSSHFFGLLELSSGRTAVRPDKGLGIIGNQITPQFQQTHFFVYGLAEGLTQRERKTIEISSQVIQPQGCISNLLKYAI